eukprot:gene20881-22931_t
MSVNAVNTDTLVDSITAQVVEKIKEFSLSNPEGESPVSHVNYVNTRFDRGRTGGNAPPDIVRHVAIKDTTLGIRPARIIINDYVIQNKSSKQMEKNSLLF